jgi:hypothetical protein
VGYRDTCQTVILALTRLSFYHINQSLFLLLA